MTNRRRHQQSNPPQASAASKWRRRWLLPIAGLVALAVFAAGAVLWVQTRSPLPRGVDLASVDPQVASRIREKLEHVREQPESAQQWGELGLVLRAYGFSSAALECLAKAEKRDLNNPRWPYFQALILETEEPSEALQALRRCVHQGGAKTVAPRYRLAWLLVEQGRWEEALAEIDQLLRFQPDLGPALLLRARCRQFQDDVQAALEWARKAEADPRSRRAAAVFIAGLLRKQGDIEGAGQAEKRASVAPPDEPVHDPFEAEASRWRDDARRLSQQGHALLAAGQLDAARPIIQQLVERHPEVAETWLLLGREHLLRRNLAEAQEALARHLQLNPDSVQGFFQLGMVRLQEERYADAADEFAAAIRLKPDFGPAHFNHGVALARGQHLEEAVTAFREAVRHSPEHVDSYIWLAGLSAQLGQRNEAKKWLEQARMLKPNDPQLDKLYQRLNQ